MFFQLIQVKIVSDMQFIMFNNDNILPRSLNLKNFKEIKLISCNEKNQKFKNNLKFY